MPHVGVQHIAPGLSRKRSTPVIQEKGAGHALDPICDSVNSMGSWIADRLHHGRRHSCASNHRHHRGGNPGYSRPTTIVTLQTLAGQGEVFTEKE